jgi:hypothetical protein
MTRAVDLMLGEVHRYDGTVNQFFGDGIMALFGAPSIQMVSAVDGTVGNVFETFVYRCLNAACLTQNVFLDQLLATTWKAGQNSPRSSRGTPTTIDSSLVPARARGNRRLVL